MSNPEGAQSRCANGRNEMFDFFKAGAFSMAVAAFGLTAIANVASTEASVEVTGTVDARETRSPSASATTLGEELFETALAELGVKETPGDLNTARIAEYWRIATGEPMADDVPWCSVFAIAIASEAGADTENANAWARTWLNVGARTDTPQLGNVVVLSRGEGGHVGFYAGETETQVYVLSGNESDAVGYGWYSKNRVLGYRRLIER